MDSHSIRVTSEVTAREKRDQILDGALDLFAERGFHGTAMPPLAAAAGVAAGTIYRYFANKEALVNALYRREKERITERILRGFPSGVGARDQFHHLFRGVVDYAREHRASFAFLEHHHHAAYLDAESRAAEQRGYDLAAAFISETAAARITKPVPAPLLMAIVWGAIARLMKEAWDGRVQLDDATLDAAENVLWEAVRL